MDSSKEQKPKQKGKGRLALWIVGGFVLLIVVIGIIGANSDSSNTNTSSANKNTNQVYVADQDVRVGDIRWKLLLARDHGHSLKGSESKYPTFQDDKTSSGRIIEINMEVENLGSDQDLTTSVELTDSKGRDFSSGSFYEWIPEDQSLTLVTLNPNVTKKFRDYYEVPTDATDLKVKVGDLNPFTNKEALIDLGI